MTHPDPKAALEKVLERHKGKQHILSNWPTQLICPFCQCISPCDAARVAKAMLGVVEAAEHTVRHCEISEHIILEEALARAAQDLEPK